MPTTQNLTETEKVSIARQYPTLKELLTAQTHTNDFPVTEAANVFALPCVSR